MYIFVWNIILSLFWGAMTETFSPTQFVIGFVLGYFILWFTQPLLGQTRYFEKIPNMIGFILYFIWEMVLSGFRVGYYIVMPINRMKPGIVAVPLEIQSDVEILLLGTIITLTPGSVCLNLSDDKQVMYIHTLHLDDPEMIREQVKTGFERRIMELLR